VTRRTALRALAAAGLLALAPAAPAPAAPPADGDATVVVLRDGVAPAAATAALERTVGFEADAQYTTALHGFAARLTPRQRRRLADDPAVAEVTPDVVFTGTAMVPVATGQQVPAGVRRVRSATTTQAHAPADVGVAVLDTGLDLANPDLNARTGTNCIKPGSAAQDDHGHGTHVGGTLAARNGAAGVVGAAPGTTLHAVKVLDRKMSGGLSALLCGLDWVARNAAALNIEVVNMSVGAAGRSDGACGRTSGDALHAAICTVTAAGVTVVASAGNEGKDLAGAIPAAYPEVLAVTGMTDTDGLPGGRGPAACSRGETDDRLWSWSNFATSAADAARVVAGPGACVVSLQRGGGTTTMSGTSMAAPHVAGVVALCHGNGGVAGPCAGLAPAPVRQRVRADAQDAAVAGFGFAGDLLRPVTGKVLGPLVSAATY
jgi:subtilisin family serine protease